MEDPALESTSPDTITSSDKRAVRNTTASQKAEPRNKNAQETADAPLNENASLFPEDSPRGKSRSRQQRPAKRRVFSLLAEVKVASGDSRFVQALGAFREAAILSQGVRSLREIAFDTAVEEAENLLPENWRVAEALLSEVSLLSLDRAVPDNIEVRIRRAAREESITNVINGVNHGGNPEETRERLKRAARLYPGEPVLQMHLEDVPPVPGAAPVIATQTDDLESRDPQAASETVIEAPVGLHQSAASPTEQVDTATAAPPQTPLKETEKAEDSAQPDVLARVKTLLETGPLSEALTACKEASEKFPHSPGLWVLGNAIREKEEEIRLLLKKGDKDLAQLDLRAAREAFLQASGLVPLDHALRTGIANKLHARAWIELENDWRSSEALLALSDRISPGCFVPPALVQALSEKKRPASPEEAPDARTESTIDVEVLGYTEATGKPRERRRATSPAAVAVVEIDPHPVKRVMKRAAAYGGFFAVIAAIGIAITLWHPWPRHASRRNVHVFVIPPDNIPSGRAHVPGQQTTGTLTIHSNVADAEIFLNSQKYAAPKGATELALNLPPDTYLVRAVHPGYDESSPVVAEVFTGVNRDVHIFLNQRAIAVASPNAVASGQEEEHDWQEAAQTNTLVSLENFVQKYPASAYLSPATEKLQNLQWPFIDQNDPQVLEAFLSKYPVGPHGAQAREQLQMLSRTITPKSLEQNDWVATNKSDKAALRVYLAKYPDGAHAAQAARFIGMLDHWSLASLPRTQPTQNR